MVYGPQHFKKKVVKPPRKKRVASEITCYNEKDAYDVYNTGKWSWHSKVNLLGSDGVPMYWRIKHMEETLPIPDRNTFPMDDNGYTRRCPTIVGVDGKKRYPRLKTTWDHVRDNMVLKISKK